jgi:hypothetical protein
MTNQVNASYAKALQRRQASLHRYLVSVFKHQFGEKAEQLVDEAADWMARNVEESPDQKVRPIEEP